ncbi:MAG: hypothetical protein IPN13_14495 [Bacteroidetes bacterium]|nr:hypothetical protein [Bacteroidota bacterium]
MVYKKLTISEVVVDKIAVTEDQKIRITESVPYCSEHGKGSLMVLSEDDGLVRHFSQHLFVSHFRISYDGACTKPFSFNSPYRA